MQFDLAHRYLRRFHAKGDRGSVFAFDKFEIKVRKEGIEGLQLDFFKNLDSEISGLTDDAIDDLISYSDLDILTKQDLKSLSILLASELERTWEGSTSEELGRMSWTLWENTTPFPFWTSDSPIVIQNPAPKGGDNRHSIIYFSLCPRLCLVLYGRGLELVGKARNRNLYRVLGDQESFVKQQNSLQLDLCHRSIFSNLEDFRYARRLARE